LKPALKIVSQSQFHSQYIEKKEVKSRRDGEFSPTVEYSYKVTIPMTKLSNADMPAVLVSMQVTNRAVLRFAERFSPGLTARNGFRARLHEEVKVARV
jgi:hypothetical protein